MSARFQYARMSEKQDYIVCSAISHSASRCVSPSSRTRSATKSCDLSKKAYSTLASRSRDPNPKIRFLLMCSEKATAVSLSKRRSSTQEPEKKVPIINSASPTLVASAHQQISNCTVEECIGKPQNTEHMERVPGFNEQRAPQIVITLTEGGERDSAGEGTRVYFACTEPALQREAAQHAQVRPWQLPQRGEAVSRVVMRKC